MYNEIYDIEKISDLQVVCHRVINELEGKSK